MRRGYWSGVWREFRKNRLAVAGLCVVMVLITIAILAPLLANNKPYLYVTNGRVYFPILYDYRELRDKDLRREEFKGFKLFPPVRYLLLGVRPEFDRDQRPA